MMGKSKRLFPLLALRLAARNLRRRPAVPVLAVLTLALGYGAAAAIFGVYSGFGRDLPVPDGDEVRWVRVLDERGRGVGLTAEDLQALRSGTRSFASLGGFDTAGVSVQVPAGFPVRLSGSIMTPEVFELLRVEPIIGRLPTGVADGQAVVLSYELWTDRFASNPGLVGELVRIDGLDRVVVGVMPAGHRFPFQQDLWSVAGVGQEPETLALVGRLLEGVSPAQAAVDVERVLEGRREAAGVENPGLRVQVPSFTGKRGEGGEQLALATLLALVVSLVLVSCTNVSNLLLGRALARSDHLAVHAAIGAGPAQVVLQMLLEALLIAFAGAVVGVGIAAVAIRYIESTLNGHWGYYWMRVEFEPVVVAFTVALALVTGLLSGMLPAIRLGRANLGKVLRSDGAGVVGVERGGLSRWLLNGQVAFSCLALIIAILMTTALLGSRTAPGFRSEDVYALSLSLGGEAYERREARRALRNALEESAATDARMGMLAFSNVVPGLENVGDAPEIEGVAVDPAAHPRRATVLMATPPYFELLNIRLLSGRELRSLDGRGEPVALVSEGFVREFFGAGEAAGRRIRLPGLVGQEWITVVGVVADFAAYDSADSRAFARVYLPFAAQEPRSYQLLFTGETASSAATAMRGALAEIDPDLAATGTLGQRAGASVEDVLRYVRRIYETTGLLALLGGFGAAIVALVGLYGALSFEVHRRRGEIGVRMAMGAVRADVLRHVTAAGLRSVAPGLVVGFVLSAGFSPAMGVLLGRTNARDPFIYLGVFFAYVLVAVLATLIPGYRAAGVDPVRVLRSS